MTEKMNGNSLDISAENRARLKALFPSVFTETVNDKGELVESVDFEKLKAELGTFTDLFENRRERYGMDWPGKKDALRLIQTPSTATLKPCREESVNFDTTENLFIEGDNLEVLKLLQKSYYGKVKMICIDPPYNTGKEFIYPDNYSESLETYLEYAGLVDGDGKKFSTNTPNEGRFHTKWLNMMYPRLYLARNLLRDDGVIFIHIDDNEVSNLRKICDEIFGEENFVAVFPWKKRTTKSDVPFGVSQDYEWVLTFTKGTLQAGLSHKRKYYQTDDYPNDRWRLSDLTKQTSAEERPNSAFDLVDPKTRKTYPFNPQRTWAVTKDTFKKYYKEGKIVFPGDYNFLNITIPEYRVFESEDKAKALEKYGTYDAMKTVSTYLPKEVGMNEDGNKDILKLFDNKLFSFPKPISLVQYFLKTTKDKDFIILDFFAGSATTAHAVLDLNKQDNGNRKFIMVQLPEPCAEDSEAFKAGYKTIADIGKERIRRVIKNISRRDAETQREKETGKDRTKKASLSSSFHSFSATSASPRETLFSIADGGLLICLADTVTKELIHAVAEAEPMQFICLDSAFGGNDQLKANAVQTFNARNMGHERANQIIFKTV